MTEAIFLPVTGWTAWLHAVPTHKVDASKMVLAVIYLSPDLSHSSDLSRNVVNRALLILTRITERVAGFGNGKR
jgi:hypothetical protein